MCGVAGFQLTNVTQDDLDLVKRVLIETQIRGRHASGLAWYNGTGAVHCVKDSVPMEELLSNIDLQTLTYDGNLSLVAHCRYSTSDLEFNQPLGDDTFMMAHNGVITQLPPETWEETYGHPFTTRNDSEILLHEMAKNGSDSDTCSSLIGASISVVRVSNTGDVSGYTNGLRPLWITDHVHGTIYTSTRNIMTRASDNRLQPTKASVVDGCSDLQTRSM